MTILPLFVVNAFARAPFTGNPAAVVPLDAWIPDKELQAIAEQNNLAETAFVLVHPDESGARPLRWFTPAREVRLCGHATLAAAFCLSEMLEFPDTALRFNTLSGELRCTKLSNGEWQLDFPADGAFVAPDVHDLAEQVVGKRLRENQVFVGKDDAMVVLDAAAGVLDYEPNHLAIRRVPRRGIILTAAADPDAGYDVVSRCFYPEFGVDEDPVTGSAHALIAPYWSGVLGRDTLVCLQASRRGGFVTATYTGGERVLLAGGARAYASGELSY